MPNNKTIPTLQMGDYILSLPCANNDDLLFSRTVVLLAECNEEETLGFILNKPSGLVLNEIVDETTAAFTVYLGGPVEQDRLFCIHQRPDLIPGSKYIKGELYWGGEFEVIFELINTNQLNKEDIRFFMGYSGWGVDQLVTEFSALFWKKTKALSTPQLFTLPSDEYWKNSIQTLGADYKLYINAPLDPTFN